MTDVDLERWKRVSPECVCVCVCGCSGPDQVAAKPNVPHLLLTHTPPSPPHLKPGLIQIIPEPFQ